MVDKNCWLGPGANKPFDSKLSEWRTNKLTKRSICVLRYIEQHSPIDINEYEENIIGYLNEYSVGGNKLNKKHTYAPFLFVGFIEKDQNTLKITEEGIGFLDHMCNQRFEEATELYLDSLFMANFESEATDGVDVSVFPVQIMFKMLYDKKIIPLFMFQTHIQYINDFSDLFNCLGLLDEDCFFSYIKELQDSFKEDSKKFKSTYKLATDKWRTYVIGGLVSLDIFDKDSYAQGYLKFTKNGMEYVEMKNIANMNYESMFY